MHRRVTAITTRAAAPARDLRAGRAILHRCGRAACLLMTVAGLACAASPAAAGAAVPDPERDATTQTAWHWYTGLTAAQIAQRLAADRDRIVDLEVQSTSPDRFAVATVRNEGVYRRSWYWYTGLTAPQVRAKLKQKKGRLIDLETYIAGGARRFAAVMVVNTGPAVKRWHWYSGLNRAALTRRLRQHRSRPVDIESYREGGTTKYAVVMIANRGADKTDSWLRLDVPLSTVQSGAAVNSARTFSLDRLPNGKYNAIQVKHKGEFSTLETDVDAGRVGDMVSQNAGRIVDIDAYKVGAQQRFTVVVNDNADPFNARVRDLARASQKLREARFGFFVKQVGGPVSVSLGADRIFEPASALKTLHHLYLHTRLEATPPESLNRFIEVPWDFCPSSEEVKWNALWTLDNADRSMMAFSNNDTTFAIEHYFGRNNLNQYAHSIGATSTLIKHHIGCWETDSTTTLVDLARMIEGASDGSLLKAESVRNRFFDTMIQGQTVDERLAALIAEEAGLARKSPIAPDFIANVVFRAKGGNYGLDGRVVNAEIGRILIPFKVNGQVQQRAFAIGHFYNCADCSDAETTINPAFRLALTEKFRATIRAAIATW